MGGTGGRSEGRETGWACIPLAVSPWQATVSQWLCSSTEGPNSCGVILSYSPGSILIIGPSSCPLGSGSGKVVAGSWVFHSPLWFLLTLLTPLPIVSSFKLLQLYPLAIFLPGPRRKQSLCQLCRETIPRLCGSQYSSRPKFWEVFPLTPSPFLP